jgi:AcrR family transcriptional regulator
MGAVAGFERSAPFAPVREPVEDRIVQATLECIERWGMAKTTADDIARAAGISRATLYRTFPGGMDVVFEAVVRHEIRRFFDTVTERLDDATDAADLLVVGIVEAARFLLDHRALGYVLAHEPERVLPALAFHRLDRALAVATTFTAPHLRRFVPDDDTAAAKAEWLVRILLSYAIDPSPALELTNEASVRRYVLTYLLPVLVPSPEGIQPAISPPQGEPTQ